MATELTRDPERRRALSRSFLTVIALDLAMTVSLTALWLGSFGLSDRRVLLPLMVVRFAATGAHVLVLLAPLRRFVGACERGEVVPDAEIMALDGALERMPARLSISTAIGWFSTLALSVVLPALGIPAPRSLAQAEILAAVMMTVVALIATPTILFGPLRASLHAIELEVGTAVLERRLAVRRRRIPMATVLTAHHVAGVLLLLLGGAAIVMNLRIREIRSVALHEQLRRAELVAISGEARPGVEILAAEDLPSLVRPKLSPEIELGEERMGFDKATGELVAAVALADGRWAVVRGEAEEELGKTLILVVLVCGLVATMAVIDGRAIARAVIDPIEELDARTRELVEVGRLARINRVVPLRNDEVGRLAGTFNEMLDAVDELAAAAAAVAEGDLRVEIDGRGDLPEAFAAMLERLRETVGRLDETTTELGTAASELLLATETQQRAAEEQSASVIQVGRTMHSLAHSAGQITAAAKSVRDNAERSLTTAAATVVRIEALDSQARGVRELLELIREVADRSDLLALNGSLEAVRAGEAGRSFGLVAAEMRRLAERVSGAVADIRGQIGAIEGAAGNTVTATQEARELAQSTAEAARAIDEALAEQHDRTEEAVAGTERAQQSVGEFVDASAQTRATAEGLRAHARELARLTASFRT